MSTLEKHTIADALEAVHAKYHLSPREEDKAIAEHSKLVAGFIREPSRVTELPLENIFYAVMLRAYGAGQESK